jgi:hypothetical protein
MRGTRKIGMAGIVAMATIAATMAGSSGTGAASSSTRTVTTQTVAPGVVLSKIVDTSGPFRVYELTIDPTQAINLDTLTAGVQGDFATPSQIGVSHGALAAINGDFTIDPGRPLHPFAQDGMMRQSGVDGAAFAMSLDKKHTYVANQHPRLSGKDLTTKAAFTVDSLNTDAPRFGHLAAYSTFGGAVSRPSAGGCLVRLKMPGRLHWGIKGIGVTRDWVVDRSVCGARLSVLTNTMVLASNATGNGARTLKGLVKGQVVRMSWSLGWGDVMDTVGGMPMLVTNGVVTTPPASCNSYFCSQNPRTGIGVTATGKILLVVVDGRQRQSVGMTLNGFAHYMISLGARNAINLDGGGGSAMWIQGLGLVNHPSDYSGERPVTNAVLVLPGVDPHQSVPLPFSNTPAPGSAVARAARLLMGAGSLAPTSAQSMTAAIDDPGSTGGLMSALADGSLGPVGTLPAGVLRTARAFVAAHR